ncbi:MAG: hypothetical protein ACJAWV_001808 [Flammeovirgaceae bacterium]|jgi:hypothetical protein
MLEKQNYDFKKAVFTTENTYSESELEESIFNEKINSLITIVKSINRDLKSNSYQKDSINIFKSYSICRLFTDTIVVVLDSTFSIIPPYSYNHKDIYGQEDWSNTFVAKLLITGSGNCRSLAYLYKILADEMGVKAHLALSPNHIYIKQHSKKIGWYNTELTSGSFPTDGQIMSTGYVSIESIRNGVYMKALTEQESIALCVFDLAKGFQRKFKGKNPEFIIKCCDLSLKYFPKNISAMLLKAETLKSILEEAKLSKEIDYETLILEDKYKSYWEEMERLYMQAYQLGYRPITDEMYESWLEQINKR